MNQCALTAVEINNYDQPAWRQSQARPREACPQMRAVAKESARQGAGQVHTCSLPGTSAHTGSAARCAYEPAQSPLPRDLLAAITWSRTFSGGPVASAAAKVNVELPGHSPTKH